MRGRGMANGIGCRWGGCGRVLAWIVFPLCFVFPCRAEASLTLHVNYSGDAQLETAFQTAANTWQGLLTGYQDGFIEYRTGGSSATTGQVLSDIYIDAATSSIDGVGGTLGSAGWNQVARDASDYWLATDGQMTFDEEDLFSLSGDQLNSLILHEMGHVLGLGTLWTQNDLVSGSEFIGVEATAVWQSEFGQTGTPDIETEGGAGTAGGHWNENLNGSGLTGITDSLGRDMRDELMTGWLNPNSFLSELTLASFRDIGFTTANATAVPEPGSLVLLSALGIVVGIRRRAVQRRM
ncbi:zinc metalloendopeptidase [Rhodopirellula islandica]|uniref:Zinc metalloendopeptidase n=1 Tax=Rhodopirellula islandica TaxID=595434 RepID=A0A0J1BJC3_RHOIS|nr:zinc metalloendopeptidase [Rhodopirellula islandica]